MAQRISQAKRILRGRWLDRPGGLAVVLRVLYFVYTPGHAGRVDLADEAIGLAHQLTPIRPVPAPGLGWAGRPRSRDHFFASGRAIQDVR